MKGTVSMNVRKEEEKATDNVVPLKALAGGLPPSTGNWLLDLPIGTRFTVRSKSDPKNFLCLDLEIINKTARTVMLWELSSGNPLGGTGRVDPIRFVQQFDKMETLPSIEDLIPREEETTENNNGESNRSTELDA